MNRDDAITLVDTFLRLCAERKLDEAAAYLAPGATMVFPPSKAFTSLPDMAANARGRYRRVDKVRERWDVFQREDGTTVVYSLGTLFGDNLHGVPFSGVRYLDRFEITGGKIALQEVWNDLAVSGVLDVREAAAAGEAR